MNVAEDDEEYDSPDSSDLKDSRNEMHQEQKVAVYNTAALHEKLEDISWTEEFQWIDTLVIEPSDVVDNSNVDVNDDLAREMAFYTQALGAAKTGYLKLHEMKIPFLRPADFYAEMVKSDSHMLKIKDRLLAEHRQMAEQDERRKQRDLKKYSKEVQAEKMKERAKQKKTEIESVKKWRKVRQKSDFTEGGETFPMGLGDGPDSAGRNAKPKGDRSLPKFGQSTKGHKGPAKKRQMKDSKFGFGGRKKLFKQNSGESSADMSGFKGGNKGFLGVKSKGGKSGFKDKKQRPGKARRQSSKK